MIRVRNVTWRVGGRAIVENISFDVTPGGLLGLIGPNGSGKSSLLRVMAGLRRPSAGHVTWDGVAIGRLPRKVLARRVAFVDQQAATSVDLTVRNVVELGRLPHRSLLSGWRAEDEAAVMKALEAVGMADQLSRSWKTLSGGEQQRVQLARALAQEPSEVLLDEPTNHLDIEHQLKLLGLIKKLGLTSVVALHDLNLAAMFCDCLMVLRHGRMVGYGAPDTVLTEALLQDVFRVRARLDVSPHHGRPHIHFLP